MTPRAWNRWVTRGQRAGCSPALKDVVSATESHDGQESSYPGGELEALRQSPNYYRWLLRHFLPYAGERMVEVGAGLGTVAGYVLQNTKVAELILIEPAHNLFPLLRERFSVDSRVKLVHGQLEHIAPSLLSVDSAIAVNVLEHVADDRALLRTINRVLRPGGVVLLFVPALPWLYGTLDESFQHVRRYTKRELARRLEETGFHVERLHYFNNTLPLLRYR